MNKVLFNHVESFLLFTPILNSFKGTSKSANQCLKQCQSIEKCQWSTFDKRYRTCHLYKDCIEVTINNCEECTTSHVKCMDPLCDIPGYCEVEIFSFAFYELQNIDISFLGICYGFYYDGYNV